MLQTAKGFFPLFSNALLYLKMTSGHSFFSFPLGIVKTKQNKTKQNNQINQKTKHNKTKQKQKQTNKKTPNERTNKHTHKQTTQQTNKQTKNNIPTTLPGG